MHSFSLQLSNRHPKYYKSLFLGIADMAIVNGYIVHNAVLKSMGKPTVTHAAYMDSLQASLVQATAKDFALDKPQRGGGGVAPLDLQEDAAGHVLTQSSEQREYGGVKRLRQRACKVCSVYKVTPRR